MMTWYYRYAGTHVHVRVFCNGGHCGNLAFRADEFEEIRPTLKTAMLINETQQKKKRYQCKVYWEMYGIIELEASSAEQAATFAIQKRNLSDYDDHGYVPDSCECDPDTDVKEVTS